jgi:hypothetical protein
MMSSLAVDEDKTARFAAPEIEPEIHLKFGRIKQA